MRFMNVIVVMALISAAATGCGPRFSITAEQIEQDVVGKEVAGIWVFDASEPKAITIIETTKSGQRAAVVIDMTTSAPTRLMGAFNIRPAVNMAGRLRLQYEYVAGQWVLVTIESLTFRRIS